MMKKLGRYLFSFLLWLAFTDIAAGCTCSDPSVKRQLSMAKNVFVGKVLSKKKSDAVMRNGVEVTLQVERVWKGGVTKITKIHTGPTEDVYDFFDMCATPIKLGERYIVFAYGGKMLSTDVCAGTGGFPYAEKIIQQLGEGRVPKNI